MAHHLEAARPGSKDPGPFGAEAGNQPKFVRCPPLCETPVPEPEPEQEPEPAPYVEAYAPRAAVYEALPGFLLRLDAPGSRGATASSQGPAGWARLSGGSGAHAPERASVGARYGFGHHSLEAGLVMPLGDGVAGLASIRSLRGSADVSATTGGGRIEASGFGAALGLSATGANGLYARGGLSYTDYELDFASDTRGVLRTGVSARGRSLDLEAGLRSSLGGRAFVTPRVSATGARIDVNDFTDALGSRVSVVDASRFRGTAGLVAGIDRWRDGSGGALDLRGSLDLERTFAGTEARVRVSGEELFSVAPRTRLNLALGGSWRRGGLALDMAVSARGLGSDDSRQSGHVVLKLRF